MKLICNEECALQKDYPTGNIWTVFTSVLVLLMPKCALCWAAYMNILTALGITIKYQSWFRTLALALFLVTLIKLLVNSIRRKNFLALMLAVAGGLLIISQRSSTGIDPVKTVAVLMLAISVFLDKIVVIIKILIKKEERAVY